MFYNKQIKIMEIDLKSENTYYIWHERGHFGTYPKEINAEGRTKEEVYEDMKENRQIGGIWELGGPYTRDEEYHEYKKNVEHVKRTSAAFW